MKSVDKKKKLSDYKEREIIGGIYIIKNNITGKVLIESTADLNGIKNRFEFSKKTKNPFSLKLQNDWNIYGEDAFTFEIIEEIKKGENQTTKEFADDLKLLKDIWHEKYENEELY